MQLRHAELTDVGRARDHNEDTFRLEPGTEQPAGALFLVCDGAGGLAAGETASDLAAQQIVETYYANHDANREAALIAAFAAANNAVYTQGQGQMGTTGVAAVLLNDAVLIANVGDSRAILVRDGQPRQISRDHSFVAEQVAAGVITTEQARVSSYRNIITRALGSRPEVETDVFREPLLVGDCVVLCSDGLHGLVEPEEIAQAVTLVPLPQAVKRLIALANDRGGSDNITVVAVQVAALSFAPDQPRSLPPTARLAAASTPAAAVVSSATDDGERTERAPESTPPRPATTTLRAAPAPVPPPLAVPQAQGSGRSFVGWLVVLIALLALVGTLAWLTINPSAPPPIVTPPLPTLPRAGSTNTAAPGSAASASATVLASPTLVPTPVPTTGPPTTTP